MGGAEFSEPPHKLFTFHRRLGEFEVVGGHVEVVFFHHLVPEGATVGGSAVTSGVRVVEPAFASSFIFQRAWAVFAVRPVFVF